VPIIRAFIRVRSLPNSAGLPEALPPRAFFIVCVGDPNPIALGDESLVRIAAFIAIPSEKCSKKFEQSERIGDTLNLGPVPCTFYCRATIQMVGDISIVQKIPDWKRELFDEDGLARVHFCEVNEGARVACFLISWFFFFFCWADLTSDSFSGKTV